MRILTFLSLFAVFVSCSSTPSENKVADRINAVEQGLRPDFQLDGHPVKFFNIEERMKELNIPGLSIAVLVDGEIEWAKAYGMADSSLARPMTTNTLLLAASISKPVSATRAHMLAEEGLINLDTNVNKYLTSWQLPDNEFTRIEKVTTRRILNHTAGLTVWGFPGYDRGDTIPTVVEVLDGLGNTDSVRVYKEPGESWQYSGGGYTIMQLMLTDLEGKSFPDLMQENVLNPLGMTQSTYANPLPNEFHGLAATGYRRDGGEVEGKWPIYPEMAAAGLWTTPSQLILWAKEIQHIYQHQVNGLLKVETVNKMLTPGMGDFGLGPATDKIHFGHDGADEGFRSRMIAWKDHPVAFVVMVNSDNFDIIPEITTSIAQAYDLPGFEPVVKREEPQTSQQLQRFVGTYNIPQFGNLYMAIEEDTLMTTADFFEETIRLLPENDSTFFSADSGEEYAFTLQGDSAVGFTILGYRADRLIE